MIIYFPYSLLVFSPCLELNRLSKFNFILPFELGCSPDGRHSYNEIDKLLQMIYSQAMEFEEDYYISVKVKLKIDLNKSSRKSNRRSNNWDLLHFRVK